MTEISYVHSIPQNEFADRGAAAQLAKPGYVPYLSLTEGEMNLELIRQRYSLLSRFYPEVPEYARAVQMIDTVLGNGLHRGVSFVGSVPDVLQGVAQIIANSVHFNRPAAGALLGRQNALSGIGQVSIDAEARYQDCLKNIKINPGAPGDVYVRAQRYCQERFSIEKIVNGSVVPISHHIIYQRLNDSYPDIPSRVYSKMIGHQAGIEGLSNVTTVQKSLVSLWVDNATIEKNVQINAGPLDGIETSFALSKNSDSELSKYVNYIDSIRIDRPNATIKGMDPVVVQAIVQAIGQAVTAALAFINALKQQELAKQAMSEARGFGTDAFSASQNDWIGGPNNPTTGEQNNKLITYAALGLGAYFLLDDN